ncbi:hypothetical protein [Chitinophaga sp. XS-30]|uniref:hypothetical protein n=1 Tax=Chitinophaga sp. XS-30 TaxID=2604421 RepID=UPI00143DFEDD|nr:hypothetical protein [Chitinophaga sp. XS-30]
MNNARMTVLGAYSSLTGDQGCCTMVLRPSGSGAATAGNSGLIDSPGGLLAETVPAGE